MMFIEFLSAKSYEKLLFTKTMHFNKTLMYFFNICENS